MILGSGERVRDRSTVRRFEREQHVMPLAFWTITTAAWRAWRAAQHRGAAVVGFLAHGVGARRGAPKPCRSIMAAVEERAIAVGFDPGGISR
jgi:hypothetical protein